MDPCPGGTGGRGALRLRCKLPLLPSLGLGIGKKATDQFLGNETGLAGSLVALCMSCTCVCSSSSHPPTQKEVDGFAVTAPCNDSVTRVTPCMLWNLGPVSHHPIVHRAGSRDRLCRHANRHPLPSGQWWGWAARGGSRTLGSARQQGRTRIRTATPGRPAGGAGARRPLALRGGEQMRLLTNFPLHPPSGQPVSSVQQSTGFGQQRRGGAPRRNSSSIPQTVCRRRVA